MCLFMYFTCAVNACTSLSVRVFVCIALNVYNAYMPACMYILPQHLWWIFGVWVSVRWVRTIAYYMVCTKWTNERSRSNEQTNQSANQQAESYISTHIHIHHVRTHTCTARQNANERMFNWEMNEEKRRRHELSETPYNNDEEEEE